MGRWWARNTSEGPSHEVDHDPVRRCKFPLVWFTYYKPMHIAGLQKVVYQLLTVCMAGVAEVSFALMQRTLTSCMKLA